MSKDRKNVVTVYYLLHCVLSIVLWLVFTTNHPLRSLNPSLLRQGLSVILLIFIYFCFGYIAMLVRSQFLKNPFDAVKAMLWILVINSVSAVIVVLTHSVLSFSWLTYGARVVNFPAYLFLFVDQLMVLNVAMIAVIPPLSYLFGLLLRQIYY